MRAAWKSRLVGEGAVVVTAPDGWVVKRDVVAVPGGGRREGAGGGMVVGCGWKGVVW